MSLDVDLLVGFVELRDLRFADHGVVGNAHLVKAFAEQFAQRFGFGILYQAFAVLFFDRSNGHLAFAEARNVGALRQVFGNLLQVRLNLFGRDGRSDYGVRTVNFVVH